MPLKGVRVLELGQLLAAPFTGYLLAGFGADVIKVEPPGAGDPMRVWRKLHNGTSLWWHSISRNKKSITLDLRQAEGQELLRKLVARDVDVLIENFRPGRMEEWGLGYDALREINPSLIMVRISGWGQTGPYAQRPGFASVAEGIGGLRYLTGDPDRPPVRSSISLGDTLTGLHAAYGALLALFKRERSADKRGQLVDAAIYESVFHMLESLLPEFDLLGYVRERSGSSLQGIVPSNTYACSDGKYVIIGGNNDSIFTRLMTAVGRPDMAADERLKGNPARVEHEAEIDAAIGGWTSARTLEEVLRVLNAAEVPVGPIYSIEDIVKDEQYLARKMFDEVAIGEGRKLKIPRIVPLLDETPGKTVSAGPALGEHNDLIYGELLGVSAGDRSGLAARKII